MKRPFCPLRKIHTIIVFLLFLLILLCIVHGFLKIHSQVSGVRRRSDLADEPDAVAARVRVPPLVHARRPPRDADAPRQAVLLRRRQRTVDPPEVGDLRRKVDFVIGLSWG